VKGELQSLQCVLAYLPEASTTGANTAWQLKDVVTVCFPLLTEAGAVLKSLRPGFLCWETDLKPAVLMDFPGAPIGTTVILQGNTIKKRRADEKQRELSATRKRESGDPTASSSKTDRDRKAKPKQCLSVYAILPTFLETGKFSRFDYYTSTLRNEHRNPLSRDWAGATLSDLDNSDNFEVLSQHTLLPYFTPGTKLWVQHEDLFYACVLLRVNLDNTVHLLMIAADANASGIELRHAEVAGAGGTTITFCAGEVSSLCLYVLRPQEMTLQNVEPDYSSSL
jgi:hypothetical protein